MVPRSQFQLRHCPFLLVLIFAIGGSYADAAKTDPTSEPQNSFRLSLPESGWVLADLDGDHKPDFAGGQRLGPTKDGYFYQVQLQLSSDAASGSFTVLHTDMLGLKITGLDIDGDKDIDLIISDRFFAQHIGIWLNDGKGRFVRSLPGLFSPGSDVDLAFFAINPNLARQPSGDRERRRLPDCLPAARYIQRLPLKNSASSQHPVEWIFCVAVDPLHQRAPPTLRAV